MGNSIGQSAHSSREAERLVAYGLSGWRIARRRWIDPKSVKGTIDPNWVQLFLAERKAGITLHIWNPVDFQAMQRRKEEPSRAGVQGHGGLHPVQSEIGLSD